MSDKSFAHVLKRKYILKLFFNKSSDLKTSSTTNIVFKVLYTVSFYFRPLIIEKFLSIIYIKCFSFLTWTCNKIWLLTTPNTTDWLLPVDQAAYKDDTQNSEPGVERVAQLLRHHGGRHDQENSQVSPTPGMANLTYKLGQIGPK